MRFLSLCARETELRQRDGVVEFLEDDFDTAADLGLGVFRIQQIAGEQRTRRLIQFDDDAFLNYIPVRRVSQMAPADSLNQQPARIARPPFCPEYGCGNWLSLVACPNRAPLI